MATSFTEQAILSVVDKSSPNIRKINSELKKLFATAKSLKSIKVDIKVNTRGLTQATAEVKALNSALRSLRTAQVKLTVTPSGIAAAQRAITQLQAQAAKPVTVNVRPGPTGPRIAQRQPGPWGSVAPPALRTPRAPVIHAQTAHITARSLAATVAGSYVAHAALTGTARAVKEGTRTVDVGETSLALKEIQPGERLDFVNKQIHQIGREQAARPGGGMWNLGHIQTQYSEMLGVVKIGAARNEEDFRNRATAAKYLADQNLELAATFVKLGMSQDQAQETSVKFGKAMEQQGKIFDASGKLNVEAAAAEYNNIRKLIPAIGKEATGENYLALMKYLRVAKFSLEPEAIASAMFKFEEMGTGAAVGINQLIKNLQGSAKPSALAEQFRLGLIGGKEVTTGRVGRQKTKILAGEMSEADSDLLRRSPQTWVNERLIPKLREDLRRQGKTEAQIETMLNDAQESGYVARQTQKLASDRTAQEMLASMILLRNENAEALKDFRSRSGTMESQRQATALSVVGATAAISSQFQGLFGEAARAAAPMLVPALGAVTEGLRSVGETVRLATEGDKEAREKINKGFVTTALAAPLAAIAAGPIMKAIGTMTAPLGMATGLSGALTAKDDTTRSLALAGTSLNAAATSLQGAALAQLTAAGAAPGLMQKMLPFLGVAGGAAGIAGGLILAQKTGALDYGVNAFEKAAAEAKLKIVTDDLAKKQAELAERQAKPLKNVPGMQVKEVDRLNREIAALTETQTAWRAKLDAILATPTEPPFDYWKWYDERRRQQAAQQPPAPAVPPKPGEQRVEAGKVIIEGKGERWLYPQPVTPKDQLLHGKVPRGDPKSLYPKPVWELEEREDYDPDTGEPIRKPPEEKPKITVTPKPVSELDKPLSNIQLVASQITEAPSKFATVFSTGATDFGTSLKTAGTDAAKLIADGAAGAGAAYGNAAVEKIRGAVANLQVTVNQTPGAKPNTGTQVDPT